MSLGPGDRASETGDDSLSAITFDSDFETKAKRKGVHRPPPTSPKSPYHSKPRRVTSWRSLRTAASMPLGSRVSMSPQKLWLGSAKPGHVPGTPVYREKEDMYDEIIELKKLLHVQKSDVDLMKTKLRRLEEENIRKDRQIEQLLGPSRGPDFVRTLAEKRPDPAWVVNGLRQRVLKLEQQCKDKDNTIYKLQTDMKTTNLEEMRIAMEMYYEEIHRLQTLVASSETAGRKPPEERRTGPHRQKKGSSTLLSLSRSVQELTEENQSLKEDLDRVLSNSPTAPRTQGYVEWSKPRLLRRITELEKNISSIERPKSHAAEVDRLEPLGPSAPSSAAHGQPRAGREESTRLRGALRSLRGERGALQAQLQERDLEVKQLLQAKADLQKELEAAKESEAERREREEALRKEIHTLTQKFQELEEIKEKEGDPVEVTPEAQEEPQPPGPASCPAQQQPESDASPHCTCSEGRRQAAARILQAQWKAYKHQKTEAVLDEAAAVLQAAFRGHLVRTTLLSSKAWGSEPPSLPSHPSQLQEYPSLCLVSPGVQAEGGPGQEEAIIVIQAVLRAHLARVGPRGAPQGTTRVASLKRRSAAATHSEPSSPPRPAASGKDNDVSSGDTVDRPAPEAEHGVPRWPGAPATPRPCPAKAAPSGLQHLYQEDMSSDDSDEVVLASSLPLKKSHPPP